MTKKSKIILGLAVLVVIVGILSFLPKKEIENKVVDEKIMIPTQTPTNYGSDTGAKEISLTQTQYDEVFLIKSMRKSMPIDRTYFSIDFDYGINKFVVKLKDVDKGTKEFEKWLADTGYSVISKQYFQIQ
jgi:hypothetical protein